MTRLLRPLAAGAVAATLITGVASAQSANSGTCGSLSYTGPGSTNTISCDNNSQLNISCSNSADVVYINGQASKSGNATLNGNTSGGNANSGNASNSNSNTTNVDLSCAPAQTTSATTTPSTPSSGGKGAVAGASTQAASLPNTGSNPLALAAIAAGVLGTLAVVTRLGVKAYSSFRA